MDRKKKVRLVLTVCFVMVCGVISVGLYDSQQGKEQIVLEQPEKEINDEIVPESQEMLYVHICGEVAAEGVYSLEPGSRVTDAVTAAGGFLADADTTYHNLAALLTDGQKVYIPSKEETKEVSVSERAERSEESVTPEEKEAFRGGEGQETVNLNTAGMEELTTLSGIGEAKANSILQYREKVGAFQSIEELKNVSGIGDALFDRVKEYIIVE